MKFIVTKDAETASKLEKLGYNLITKQENTWTFLNDKKLSFSEKEKIVETNNLTF